VGMDVGVGVISITYKNTYMNNCCASAVSQQEECFAKSSSCSGQGKNKCDMLGSAWLGFAFFGSLSFFGSFGPILAYFGFFVFLVFFASYDFLALSGLFWLFFALCNTLQHSATGRFIACLQVGLSCGCGLGSKNQW
jgi:hypothetical protein